MATLPNGDVLVAGGTEGTTSKAAVSLAEVYHVTTGQWEVVSPMLERRSLAVAVTLPTGLVLVFGGSRDSIPLASAELFDPRTNTWSGTGPMTAARTDFAAVRLADGRVMAVGGGTGTSATAVTTTAEIYDSTAGTWSPTSSMATARAYESAVVLGDGSVLVVGGRTTYYGSTGSTWATAERWNPSTGAWSAAGTMSDPRYFAAAAALPDGSAIAVGGWPDAGSTGALSSVDLYDLVTGSWRPLASMTGTRAAFGMVALGDGRILAVAGQTSGSNSPSTTAAELFNPTNRSWTSAGSLATPVWYPAAALLPGRRVLVAGGAVNPEGSTSTTNVEVFTPPLP